MKQSRAESLAEAVVSTAFGFLVALVATPLILRAFGLPVGAGQAVGITAAFTLVSVLRGYAVRRFFNAGLHRATMALAGRLRRWF